MFGRGQRRPWWPWLPEMAGNGRKWPEMAGKVLVTSFRSADEQPMTYLLERYFRTTPSLSTR
jgi:hypothetical protein